MKPTGEPALIKRIREEREGYLKEYHRPPQVILLSSLDVQVVQAWLGETALHTRLVVYGMQVVEMDCDLMGWVILGRYAWGVGSGKNLPARGAGI